MSGEFETAAAASAGALNTPSSRDDDGGELCRNCGTPVTGRFCCHCGQSTRNFHRPVLSLFAEGMGDFFSLDGRVAKTIPSLLFQPGRVTRDYLDGKRQRFVPPFRLYLLASFLFFFCFFTVGTFAGWLDWRVSGDIGEAVTELNLDSGDTSPEAIENAERAAALFEEDGKINREQLEEEFQELTIDGEPAGALYDEVVDPLVDVYENRALFISALQTWAPRLALLFAPVLVLSLTILYPFRKHVFIYDHIIASLHYQTWYYFLLTFAIFMLWGQHHWVLFLVFFAPPVYLYKMFRVVYSSGRISSFFRTVMILLLLAVVASLWFLVVFLLSATETAEITREVSR